MKNLFTFYYTYKRGKKGKSHLKLWKEKVLLASRITHHRSRGGLCAVTPFLPMSQQRWTPTQTSTCTHAIALARPRCGELISSVPARTSSRTHHFLLPRDENCDENWSCPLLKSWQRLAWCRSHSSPSETHWARPHHTLGMPVYSWCEAYADLEL